jgi:hypothetical protein
MARSTGSRSTSPEDSQTETKAQSMAWRALSTSSGVVDLDPVLHAMD